VGNRNRIIDAAVELINRDGSAVGTRHLAEHLSISPGNLYYHFRNLEEILSEVLLKLEADLDEELSLAPGEYPDASGLAEFFIGGAKVLWRYRFFFSSSLDLIRKDPQLVTNYRDFCVRGIAQVDLILSRVLKKNAGAFALTRSERGKLAENLWIIWTSWPRYIETMLGSDLPQKEILRNHEYLEFQLKPYLDPAFYKVMVSYTKKLKKLDD
jgi:AcrR family transcriptional regulator